MPHFCYPFMKEWGSCVCGTCMVLFSLVCIIVGFMFFKRLFKRNSEKPDQGDNTDKPVEILKNRYANGEIDRAEFLKKKKDLEE